MALDWRVNKHLAMPDGDISSVRTYNAAEECKVSILDVLTKLPQCFCDEGPRSALQQVAA